MVGAVRLTEIYDAAHRILIKTYDAKGEIHVYRIQELFHFSGGVFGWEKRTLGFLFPLVTLFLPRWRWCKDSWSRPFNILKTILCHL